MNHTSASDTDMCWTPNTSMIRGVGATEVINNVVLVDRRYYENTFSGHFLLSYTQIFLSCIYSVILSAGLFTIP